VAQQMSATYGLRSSGSSASAALQLSLVSRLPALLDSHGSTMFAQTWKTQVTPLGRRILAHTARARLTSDNGCSSWPTPDASAGNLTDSSWEQRRAAAAEKHGNNGFGMTLGQATQLASWATPTTRHYRSESATDEFNEKRWGHPRGKPLSAEATLVSGPTANGSPAETARPGQLNPEFSLWLMGIPAAWASCAPQGMRSSRRLPKPSSGQR
jgi:hypothetical protein